MIHMPETANCVVPLSQIYMGCSRGKNVDIVGVTSSILVTPTILLPLFPKRCAVLVAAFTYFSTGSLNLKARRFNA